MLHPGLRIFRALLLNGFVYGQSSSSASKSNDQNSAENFVRLHQSWGPQASTPNTSLIIMESTRSGPVIKFRLIAGGLPKDGVYALLSWPVTQKGPTEVLSGVTLNAAGLAICAGAANTCGSADKPNDPIDVTVRPIPGEPLRLGLVSTDGATRVLAKVVPLPLHGEDRGCSIDGTLLTPGAELILIEGSAFPPNSEITMDSDSAGERHSEKGKVDADGRYVTALLPYKQGVAGGVVKVNLKAPKCAPSVSVQWGRRN